MELEALMGEYEEVRAAHVPGASDETNILSRLKQIVRKMDIISRNNLQNANLNEKSLVFEKIASYQRDTTLLEKERRRRALLSTNDGNDKSGNYLINVYETGKALDEGKRTAKETADVSRNVMTEVLAQGEQLRYYTKLEEKLTEELDTADNLISTINHHINTNRKIMLALGFLLSVTFTLLLLRKVYYFF